MNDLMTKSLLHYVDLKKQAIKDLQLSEPDLEMGKLESANEQNLYKFFDEVNMIKAEMEEITNLLLDLKDLNEGSKSTHSAKVLQGIGERINLNMITVLQKAKSIKSRLEALDKSNEANSSLSMACKEISPIDRIRISVTSGLRAKLRKMMHDFQALREKILKDHEEGLRSRYFSVTGHEPSEEVVERMILGDGQERVFEGKVDLVVENQERHKALKEVQRSLNELHRVFLDMAVLVETQGDQGINDIEENVALGGSYISGGTNALHYAMQMKGKKRNWGCWVGVFLLVLMVILVSVFAS